MPSVASALSCSVALLPHTGGLGLDGMGEPRGVEAAVGAHPHDEPTGAAECQLPGAVPPRRSKGDALRANCKIHGAQRLLHHIDLHPILAFWK